MTTKYDVTLEELEVFDRYRHKLERLNLFDHYWSSDHNQKSIGLFDDKDEAIKLFESKKNDCDTIICSSNVGYVMKYNALELCEIELDEGGVEIERDTLDVYITPYHTVHWHPILEMLDDNGEPTCYSADYEKERFFITLLDSKWTIEKQYGENYYPVNYDCKGFNSPEDAMDYFDDEKDDLLSDNEIYEESKNRSR